MNRFAALLAAAGLASAALANPMDDKVPFGLEEALQCSALLYHKSKTSPDGSPFGMDEASQTAFFGYAFGAANLAQKAGKGPKFADIEVAQRQPAIKAMPAPERTAGAAKCVSDFDAHARAAAGQ
jgi:hypothetical protein